ncbi:MAG: PEGA domain-containing protein [Polyangiaceae bacterium]
MTPAFVLGVPTPAAAQSAIALRAADLVDAGELALARGKYEFAVQAFTEAQRIGGGTSLLYSVARAHHQRWLRDKDPYDLAQAATSYRRYVQAAPRGEHAPEAMTHLARLEATLEASPIDDDRLAASAAREAMATRLVASADALGASLRVDGGKAQALAAFLELAPGTHRLVVGAPGYVSATRDVVIARGMVFPASFALDAQPATLVVSAPAGATVYVDGTFAGRTPFPRPVAATPGRRLVSVLLNGHRARDEWIELRRGKETRLAVELRATSQRKGAWAVIATGGASVAAGIGLGVVSVIEHRKARDLSRGDEQLGDQEQVEYDVATDKRDDYRIASGFAGGAGLGLFLLGGALYVLDDPAVPLVAPRKDARRGRPVPPRFTATPLIGPGLAGSSVTYRF